MIVLYEVIHSVGTEEEKLYINAFGDDEDEAERDLVDYYTSLNLVNANHFKLAENPNFTRPPGPRVLTNQGDGTWLEG